jgi:4-hydroxy-2-oxoheptanedioate aldolase
MNALRDRLARHRPLVGTFCTLGVEVVDLVCHSGLDFALIDAQHGAFDVAAMRHALRAADASPCLPMARLPANGLMMVEPLLDAGYLTLIAPMVNSADEARQLVRATHYPPRGQRSQSGCRAAMRSSSDYRDGFNDAFSLLVMIEHIAGVEQIDAILAEPGVSGCFVGPTDLASSLGGGESSKRALADAIERVLTAAKRANKLVAITAPCGEEVAALGQRGFDLVAVSVDRKLLMDGLARVQAPRAGGATHGPR